jgi:hypothetical protein
MSVMDQIRKLDEQKAQLLQSAKHEALEAANKALATLRELGFNYRLVESDTTLISRVGNNAIGRSGNGARRTGIRDKVLSRVKVAEKGLTAAELITLMNPENKADKTSIRNALAALKRNGHVDIKDGKYIAK